MGYGETGRLARLDSVKPVIVLNRPQFEPATNIGSFWSEKYIKLYARDNGYTCIDLQREKAIRINWQNALVDNPACFECGVGHGNAHTYTGQQYSVLIDATLPSDVAAQKGRYGSYLSCQYGQTLQQMIDAGMKTFHGYREDFIFVCADLSNIADAIAETFGRSHFAYDQRLLKELAKGTDPATADQRAYESAQAQWLVEYKKATYPDHKQFLMYDSVIEVHAPGSTAPPPPPQPSQGRPAVRLTVNVNGIDVYTNVYTNTVDVQTRIEPLLIPESTGGLKSWFRKLLNL